MYKVRALGAPGEAWLRGLGDTIAELEQRWRVRVGSAMSGGTGAYTAEADGEDGRRLVVKLAIPDGLDGHGTFAIELRTLLLGQGHGYVRLHEYDEDLRATLQDRLGGPLSAQGLTVTDQITVICTTLRRSWVRVDPDAGLHSGAEKARWLSRFIAETWEALDGPCKESAVAQALSYAESRAAAHDDERSVLVHGDAHAHNTMRVPSTDHEYAFIDPDGLLAEPACDLAVPMREWNADLLAGDPLQRTRERCALLSRLTNVAAPAIWEWGFMERMSTGLLGLRIGADEWARDFLAVADQCVVSSPAAD